MTASQCIRRHFSQACSCLGWCTRGETKFSVLSVLTCLLRNIASKRIHTSSRRPTNARSPAPPPPPIRDTGPKTQAAAAAEERHNSRDVRLWALHSCSRCSTSRCHVDCSNRGICDHGTGVCRCFDGYHGQVRRKKRPRPTGSVAVGSYVSRKGLERPQIRMFREQSMRASAESRRYKKSAVVSLLVSRHHLFACQRKARATDTLLSLSPFLDQQACNKKHGDGYGFNTDGM